MSYDFKNDEMNIYFANIAYNDKYGYVEINLYENEGYELEHQLVKEGETYKEENWTINGDTVIGLSEGDTIYTRITDGRNS